MKVIGKFKMNENRELIGGIFTQEFQSRDVRLVPHMVVGLNLSSSHRVLVGQIEAGVASTKAVANSVGYIDVRLGDPSLYAPIRAALYKDEGSETYTLYAIPTNDR
jgi:uncharacterized protein (DUF736 family)